MADGDDESRKKAFRFDNGCPSNSDISNTSSVSGLPSASFSKFWSIAQNLTRSVFTRASTIPSESTPVDTSSTRRIQNSTVPNIYEGYVSNDEDDFDGNISPRQETCPVPSSTISDIRNDALMANKRPFRSVLDDSVAPTMRKRNKLSENTRMPLPNFSKTTTSQRRFWTSGAVQQSRLANRSTTSNPKQLFLFGQEKNSKLASASSTNLFSVPPRLLSTPSLTSVERAGPKASLAPSITEFNRQAAARNSETKRILLDLERVGTVTMPDAKRPRLWFQNITEEMSAARASAKKSATPAPPTTNLQMVEKAQVLPNITASIGASLAEKESRPDMAPPIPAAWKRTSNNETTDGRNPIQDTAAVNFVTRPSAPFVFSFSRPLSVSISTSAEKLDSASNISNTKMVSSVQFTPPVAPSFSSAIPVATAAVTSTVDSITQPRSTSSNANEMVSSAQSTPPVVSSVSSVKPVATLAVTSAADSIKQTQATMGTTSNIWNSTDNAKAESKAKWSCDNCFVSNDASANECLCCKSAKPNKSKPTGGGDVWWCGCCMIKNDAAAKKCVACGTERVPTVKVTTSDKIATSESSEKKSSNWSCTTCFLTNTADRVKCIACQSPMPGAAFKPVRLGATLFGSTISNATAFTSTTTAGELGQQKSAAIVPAFGLGDAGKTDKSASSLFGSTSVAVPTTVQTTTTDAGQQKSMATGLSFGFSEPAKAIGTDKPLFGSTNTSVAAFTSTTMAESGQQKSIASVPAFGLGETTKSDKPLSALFGFGETGKADKPPSAPFGFGDAGKADKPPPVPLFGSTTIASAVPVSTATEIVQQKPAATSSTFGFGEPAKAFGADKPLFGVASNSAAAFTPATTTETGQPKLATTFNISTFGGSKPAIANGESKAPTANGENKTVATNGGNKAPFVFGSTSTSQVPQQASIFQFGQSPVKKPDESVSLFGMKPSSSAAAFTFGQQKPDAGSNVGSKTSMASTVGSIFPVSTTTGPTVSAAPGGFSFSFPGLPGSKSESSITAMAASKDDSSAATSTITSINNTTTAANGGNKPAFFFGSTSTGEAPPVFQFGQTAAKKPDEGEPLPNIFTFGSQKPAEPTPIAFGSFGKTNGGGDSVAPSFPPPNSNLFSATQPPGMSPISGRRQLIAKRKTKRT